MDDNLKNAIKIDQQGKAISLNCDTTKEFRRHGYYTGITIICSTLKSVSARQLITAHNNDDHYGDGKIEITGFNQNTPLSI